MSLWSRFREWRRGVLDEPAEAQPDLIESQRSAGERQAPGGERLALECIEYAARHEGGASEEELGAAFDSLVDGVEEGRAIELLRRALSRRPSSDTLGLRVAERMAYRGDEGGALDVLAPLLGRPDVSARVLVLAGELAERSGDDARASLHYQAALARDVDQPGIRERVTRLSRSALAPRGTGGATLATEGAVARGRYLVERELGRGGAGTVFSAGDVHLDRRVALKVYHRRGPTELKRLRLEARIPAGLEHPGVVRIFDVDEALGAIAMESVRGGALRQRIDRGGVPLKEALSWTMTLLEAVGYVHGRGVVHRDIKPSNILIRDDGRAVLTDFGLAMTTGDAPTATVVAGEGTVGYMAPEQEAGEAAHPAADIHAIGATLAELYEAVTEPTPPAIGEWAAATRREAPEDRPGLSELFSILRALEGEGA